MKEIFLLFKNRNFLKFASADFISEMGNSARVIAIPLFVFINTKSYIMMTVATVLTSLPSIIFGPLAGKCADKYNKKHLMMFSDVFRGILDLILLFSTKNVYLVILIGFFMSLGNIFFNPAAKSLIPEIVDKENLNDANALFSFSGNTCYLIGPLLGTLLGFKITIIFDSITFFISSFLILIMGYERSISFEENMNVAKSKLGIRELFILLGTNKQLGTVVYMTFILSISFAMIPVIMPGYVTSVLGASENLYGMILSIMTFGGIVGSFINTYISKKMKEETTFILFYSIYGLIYGTLFFFLNQYVAIVLFFVQGIAMPMMGIASATLEQKLVDKKIMGRFFGIIGSIQATLAILGKFLGGVIAKYAGCLNVFLVVFVLMSVGTILGIVKKKFSTMSLIEN